MVDSLHNPPVALPRGQTLPRVEINLESLVLNEVHCAYRSRCGSKIDPQQRGLYLTHLVNLTPMSPPTFMIDYDWKFDDWEIFVPVDKVDFLRGAAHTSYGMWCRTVPTGTTGQFTIKFPGEEIDRWVQLGEYEVGMEVVEIKGEYAGRRSILSEMALGKTRHWVTEGRKQLRTDYFARVWPDNVPFEQILGVKHMFPVGTRVEYPDSKLLLHPGVVVGYKVGRAQVLDLATQETFLIHPTELREPKARPAMRKGSVPPAVKPKGRAPLPGLPKGALPPKGTPSGD